jgi:hypothetical protein
MRLTPHEIKAIAVRHTVSASPIYKKKCALHARNKYLKS